MKTELVAVAVLLLAGATGSVSARGPREFEFERLNRAYRDVASSVAPTEAGPLRVDLASPRHEVTLLRHRLRLAPRGDGTHDAELWVEFRGRGRLEARASVLGVGQGFTDDMTLPDQERILRARVRIAGGRDGYLVTTLALPPETRVQIRSRLGGRLVGWCERFVFLACGDLDAALSTATVPLPPPGRTYLLADVDLTVDDRHDLDEYLGVRKRKK